MSLPSNVPASWLDELSEFLRIPSVSPDSMHVDDVRHSGEWICRFIRDCDGTCDIVVRDGHPLVFGELWPSVAPGHGLTTTTLLLYGHFDVQPAGPLDAWQSPPFEPTVRDGWLYGRGTADDKGNLYLLLKAVQVLVRERRLPVHIKLLCDGDEEVDGSAVAQFVRDEHIRADSCLIFDAPMLSGRIPAFYSAARGLICYHISVRTADKELHSGRFGGAALNAAHCLAQLLTSLFDLSNDLNTGATAMGRPELDLLESIAPGAAVLAEQGASAADPRAAAEFYLRTLGASALDVNSFHAGEADSVKTVVPAEAHANISIRVAPGQEVAEVAAKFESAARMVAPRGADLTIDRLSTNPPASIVTETRSFNLALDAFERVLGRRPVVSRLGGTLPILSALSELGIPTILTGFDTPEGNIHAPNERFLLEYIPLGVAAAKETIISLAAAKEGDGAVA